MNKKTVSPKSPLAAPAPPATEASPPKRGPGVSSRRPKAPVFKHGFYWRQYHQDEHADLERMAQSQDLNDEILLLRVMMRRLLIQSEGLEDVQDAMRVLRILSVCVGRLAEMLRTQQNLQGSPLASEAEQAFQTALQAVKQEYQAQREALMAARPKPRPPRRSRP